VLQGVSLAGDCCPRDDGAGDVLGMGGTVLGTSHGSCSHSRTRDNLCRNTGMLKSSEVGQPKPRGRNTCALQEAR